MVDLVNSMDKFLYEIMAVISFFIRQFYLSNPFEVLGEGLAINIDGSVLLLHPEILNWIASIFLPGLTYWVVEMYYREKSNPVVGSFLYLVFFIIHNSILGLMCRFGFTKPAICIIVGLYIACHVAVYKMRERFLWQGGY